MAFKRRSEILPDSGDKVFIAEWIKDLGKDAHKQNGLVYPIKSISKVRSGKGYMLNCGAFTAFVWNKSLDGDIIRQWIDSEVIAIPSVVVDLEVKCLFQLGEDDEQEMVLIQPKSTIEVYIPVPADHDGILPPESYLPPSSLRSHTAIVPTEPPLKGQKGTIRKVNQ